jgi:prepilin-type N-terminal cleavage/methylation domain-containing protein
MAGSRRSGFTLAELLVVITIIGMLIGLLVPAVMGAREAARQAQCMNYQSNLGKAIIQYEMTKQHFPPYVKTLGSTLRYNVNWAVQILPYMGRNDVWAEWQAWQKPAYPTANAATMIDFFKCPDDVANEQPPVYPISYAVNCGEFDNFYRTSVTSTVIDWPENGVFHNNSDISSEGPFNPQSGLERPVGGITATGQKSVSMGDIKDGTQYTILLTENLQATWWVKVATNGRAVANTTEEELGVLWFPPRYGSSVPTGKGSPQYKMNYDRETVTPNYQHARPSSNHGNLIVMTFCDGHQRKLKDSMEYYIYSQLMSPCSREVKVPRSSGTLESAVNYNDWVRPISEQDLN